MEETAVCVKPDNAVALGKAQEEPSKPKKKILYEDEYIEVSLQYTLVFSTNSSGLGTLFIKHDLILLQDKRSRDSPGVKTKSLLT